MGRILKNGFNKTVLFTLGLKGLDIFLVGLSQLILVWEAKRNIIRNLFLWNIQSVWNKFEQEVFVGSLFSQSLPPGSSFQEAFSTLNEYLRFQWSFSI